MHGYRQGFSKPGEGLAATSALLALLSNPEGHYQVKLDARARERFTVWMDTYAQRLGSFSADQERRLEDLRRACADLLTDVVPSTHAFRGHHPTAANANQGVSVPPFLREGLGAKEAAMR